MEYALLFSYGRLEVVAKLPKGDWIWPAIWLLPEDQVNVIFSLSSLCKVYMQSI